MDRRSGAPRLIAAGLMATLAGSCAPGPATLGSAPDPAEAVAVGRIIDQPQAYSGRALVLAGVVIGLDQRAGRFFFLRDQRGGLFVELASSTTWSVPSNAERRNALVAGRLARDQHDRWYLQARGLTLGDKAF
ncbi:MAG TPA: hypothetical protein VGB99_00935 [Acidobacteriota bacterium]